MLGGETRKVRWEGRNNAPDKRVMIPGYRPFWYEAKDKGESPRIMQQREMNTMKRLGEDVYWGNCVQDFEMALQQQEICGWG